MKIGYFYAKSPKEEKQYFEQFKDLPPGMFNVTRSDNFLTISDFVGKIFRFTYLGRLSDSQISGVCLRLRRKPIVMFYSKNIIIAKQTFASTYIEITCQNQNIKCIWVKDITKKSIEEAKLVSCILGV